MIQIRAGQVAVANAIINDVLTSVSIGAFRIASASVFAKQFLVNQSRAWRGHVSQRRSRLTGGDHQKTPVA